METSKLNTEDGYQSRLEKDEVDVSELFTVVASRKWFLFGITSIFAILSIALSLSLPNIYKSEVLLSPAHESKSSNLGGLAGQLGGIAGLTGISLGGGDDKTTLALEVLKSRQFIKSFIEKHDLLPDLMAVKEWNQGKNEIVYDEELYDVDSKTWVRDVEPPKTAKPSRQEAYIEFKKVFEVNEAKDTGYVTISIDHQSPEIAQRWVELLVMEINQTIKTMDVVEAEKSIKFLEEQLSKNDIAELKTVLFGLIEEQVKTIMFSESRAEYVFKTIDPAIVPELKHSPKRAVICVAGTVFGFIVGIVIILIGLFRNGQKG
ncbi:Wzz/FepE/Etk N-terminal domain-containing protein [Pseudoalteromonas sp. Of7M-16]|uniref:Wzz/FepE/Etk N-terminal domain-containing protein n=1 Tax=Pseudoalteromonas sp. Of7M-16 TaxID=2917756 RepID=UPI001EF6357C|nr:Wzz/FepE/Etk N-terminal domain-containing protein [Pseudoalteromonas sp. Of7M-16]MCG7547232.1 Wzz/FepE/Etk N-terminal domain-containing protein [Pseudoalteromonas sp. Of7M-16]